MHVLRIQLTRIHNVFDCDRQENENVKGGVVFPEIYKQENKQSRSVTDVANFTKENLGITSQKIGQLKTTKLQQQ